MPEVKVGVDQMNKPAPLWYRRFSNSAIICIIPATVGLVQGLGLTPKTLNIWMMVLSFLPAVIKGVGMMMGNGQFYSDQKPQ